MRYLILPLFLFFSKNTKAQCEMWQALENHESLADTFVLCRYYIRENDFETAFSFWQKIYETSPAADGKRGTVYSEGRKLYFEKFKREINTKKKKEYAEIIIRLYEEEINCYPNLKRDPLPIEVLDF